MARKQKRYHFIYKTTNLKNGKFYIGMHSTDNLNDGYIGSGKKLWYSINYHGKENFKIEILEFLETRELLAEREKELINEDILKDPMCMNLKIGGSGGWPKIPDDVRKRISSLGAKAHNNRAKVDKEFRENRARKMKATMQSLFNNGVLKGERNFLGKKHTYESKKLMSDSHKGKHEKEKNSQYGTMWITNGIENKKIKNDSIIPENWYRGRKMK